MFKSKKSKIYINDENYTSSDETEISYITGNNFLNNIQKIFEENDCLDDYDIEKYYENKNKFGQAFIINLKDRSKRFKQAYEILEKLNLNPIRFNAILGKNIENTFILDKYKHLKISEIGCLSSHLSILYLASKHECKNNYTLIFEDDIITNINSISHIFNSLEEVDYKENVDIIYLGKCLETCSKMEHIQDNIYKSVYPLCTHAYAIKNSFACKIFEYLNNQYHKGMHEAIDLMYRNLININKCNSVVMHPSVFIQDVYKTQSDLRDAFDQQRNVIECVDVMVHDSDEKNNIYGYIITMVSISFIIIIICLIIWFNLENKY